MPEDAGLDTGLDTAVDTAVDETVDTGADEGASTEVEDATTAVKGDAKPLAGTQPYRALSEDGKQLDAKAKAHLDGLRQTDPALAKEIRNALFEADRFKRALPGGMKEVQDLRNTVEQLGGEPGIREMTEEVNGWHDFDSKYMAWDPQALEFMLSSPESQQAFMKLAPMAFNKFEELNPEGFSSYVCQRIVGDMVANRIPIALELAQHFIGLGDAARAGEELKKITAWATSIDATARKPVEAPKPNVPSAKDDPQFKELQQRDEQRTRDDWRQETATEQNRVYSTELTRLLNGRKVTDVQREDILHRVQTKLGLRIKEQEGTLNRYFSVKDKEGFLRFANSFSKKHIPELLREAVDRYVPSKPGPKPVPGERDKPVEPPVNGVAAGFSFVAQMPSSSEIDWRNPFNTKANISAGKAVTTNGKKVTWRR